MARFFDDMNRSGNATCPICKTDKPGKVLLVPIPGTEEGNNVQAQQLHAECAYIVGCEYYQAYKLETAEAAKRAAEVMDEADRAMDKAKKTID